MKTVIIGAGQVGCHVAHALSREEHDIVVIEHDRNRAAAIHAQLAGPVLTGSGTDPGMLTAAGAAIADLVIAATDDDEVNIVSAALAKKLGAERSIVRIEQPRLRQVITPDLAHALGADVIVDPDEETSAEIVDLIDAGIAQVETMTMGELAVVKARFTEHAPLVGRTLAELAEAHGPEWQYLFAVISRGDDTIIPRGDHRLAAGDLVRVVCTTDARPQLPALVGLRRAPPDRVVLLGGGRTAELLADHLVSRVQHVAIVERDHRRATELAAVLDGVEILNHDITDADVLDHIGTDNSDLVVALTGDEDADILACLYAKSVGAAQIITRAHRSSQLPMLAEIGIESAPSPRTATANAILRIARDRVAAVATFLHAEVEVIEIGIQPGSHAAGKTIAQLHLPRDALVVAVVTTSGARIGHDATTLHPSDRAILLAKPTALPAARRVLE